MSQGPVRKILLFVDGSEECITAAQYAVVLARTLGAELAALYVVNVSVLNELFKARIFIKMEQMDYEHDLEQDGRRYLNYISELGRAKGVSIETHIEKGVVNEVVVEKARILGADLLAMGELEPIKSRSDAFHDESELILRKAHCSVLVVKDADYIERLYQAME